MKDGGKEKVAKALRQAEATGGKSQGNRRSAVFSLLSLARVLPQFLALTLFASTSMQLLFL